VVDKLTVTDPRDVAKAAVIIRPTTDAGEAGVTVKSLKAMLPEGTPEVMDLRTQQGSQ